MGFSLSKIWREAAKPVIGMIHLLPLPGSPRFGGDRRVIREAMMHDAAALSAGGVHGLMLENFGDAPFYPGPVPPHVVAEMAILADEVREEFKLPLGINVLRNDSLASLGVAQAAGADFIRVNVLTGARVTDQGLVQGNAHNLLRERRRLGADSIAIFADIQVKHSAPIGPEPTLDQEVGELIERGGADAVIVSGCVTGAETDPQELARVKAAAGATPVLVGSGVTPDRLDDLLSDADGFIVGSSFKRDGLFGSPIDSERVKTFMARVGQNGSGVPS